jgi:WD40 repeat protein
MRGTHDGPVIGLEWSPDSRRFATGSGDRTARIWDATTAAELARFPHRGRVVPLTWSADGTLLVTESSGVAHVWRAASGEEVSRLALTGGARAAVLSPDTATLTTISLVGRTLLVVHHPLGQQALLAATCARLSRNLTAQEWKEYVGDEPYRKTCPNLP